MKKLIAAAMIVLCSTSVFANETAPETTGSDFVMPVFKPVRPSTMDKENERNFINRLREVLANSLNN